MVTEPPRHDRPMSEYVIALEALSLEDMPRAGGKNASLGEMIRALRTAGVRVPGGFAITTAAYHQHMRINELEVPIRGELDRLDVRNTRELARVAQSIRERIRAAPLPLDVRMAVMRAYAALPAKEGEDEDSMDVAVRSSATAEDVPTASFAGQQDTYLFVHGEDDLDAAVRGCMASLFTDRAIVYRAAHGIPHADVAISVGVQRMVRSDLACAGVMFTLDTESGFPDVVTIAGAWGLGELLVQGRVNPDEFCVHKPTARLGHRSMVRREAGKKRNKLVRSERGGKTTRQLRVPAADRNRFVLDEDEVMQLARWAMTIEDHYSKRAGHWMPMDIEWAKDGITDKLFIVQARPETVHVHRTDGVLEIDRLEEKAEPILTGRTVGRRIAVGPVRVIHNDEDLHDVKDGDVLVASMTDPDWNPVLRRAVAVVTDHGGRNCHAATIAREFGIPCVVGTEHATETLAEGQVVTVSCATGDTGRVYDGRLAYHRETIDPAALPKPPVPLMLNIASPDTTFHHARLPSDGVGLLRLEFLIGECIGGHPMAFAHLDRIEDPATRRAIREKARGFDSPAEYFVDRLACGIGQIAGSFHPRPVIVRFSDFRTNEFASLLGGASFEPKEANPMLGFRGASRYYDERYRDGFALECAAIRRVRDRMGPHEPQGDDPVLPNAGGGAEGPRHARGERARPRRRRRGLHDVRGPEQRRPRGQVQRAVRRLLHRHQRPHAADARRRPRCRVAGAPLRRARRGHQADDPNGRRDGASPRSTSRPVRSRAERPSRLLPVPVRNRHRLDLADTGGPHSGDPPVRPADRSVFASFSRTRGAPGMSRSKSFDVTHIGAEVAPLDPGTLDAGNDVVTIEQPLEVRLKRRPVFVTMRTPGEDDELVAGLLYAEGVIDERSEFWGLNPCPQDPTGNTANVLLDPRCETSLRHQERFTVTSSSCGVCGKRELPHFHGPMMHANGTVTIDALRLLEMPIRMLAAQPIFRSTGGAHAAAIFDAEGAMVVSREDVGRHNAVDKVIGYGLLHGLLPFDRHVLLISGRASYEIVQKAQAASIPIIASISAPSSLAIEMAERHGQTLIGFLREGRATVYAGGDVITACGV